MTNLYRLADWIEYGRNAGEYGSKRKVRRWLNEARGRFPIVDRVNYPDGRKSSR